MLVKTKMLGLLVLAEVCLIGNPIVRAQAARDGSEGRIEGRATQEARPTAPGGKPTLVDFFKYRFAPTTTKHVLQSATDAMKMGEKEELILACLLHDVVLNLIKVDHG